MQLSRVRPDVEQVDRIVAWLDGWQERRRQALPATGQPKRTRPSFSLLPRREVSA